VEHLNQKQFEDYCQSQLQVTDLLSVSDHLAECERCRRQVGSAINDDGSFFGLRSEIFAEAASTDAVNTHLTAEQTASYVDKQLSGESVQMIADHLTHCALCELAVEDMQAFRNQIAPSLDVEYQPARVTSSEGWWHRTVKSLPSFFRMSPVPAFGAALAVLLLILIGWVVWRAQLEKGPRQDIVVAPTPAPQPSLSVPTPDGSRSQPVTAVAQLKDGGSLLTLDQEGKLSGADNFPPAYQSMMKKALTAGRIEKSSQLNGLTRAPSSLMGLNGEKQELSVIEPVGNVLMTNRPTFRWSTMVGATGYGVEVYDDEFTLVAASPQLTNNSWSLPQSLRRGSIYSWQVKTVKDGQQITSPRPPAPQARFRVLDQARANELSKAKRAYPSSHLTLGLLYAEAGLLKEAESELHLLQKANPESELTRNLLRQVQTLRRRSE
jgi:anti-sigma factor RsiW